MREIKFRAWIDTPNIRLDGDKAFMTNKIDDLDFQNKEIYFDSSMAVDFDECKLMQFTGLKDKNGKEIYEGDITNNGVIRFGKDGEGIGFYLEELEWCERGSQKHHDTHTLFAFTTPFKVIGNIYENPELII